MGTAPFWGCANLKRGCRIVLAKNNALFYVKLVKLVHNHPGSSGFGGFLADLLWILATIFFFQNSLGLPYLYQSLNTNGFFFHPDPIRGQHYYHYILPKKVQCPI